MHSFQNDGQRFNNYHHLFTFFILVIIFFLSASNCEAKEDEPPKIGNFVLPSSQQPGALVSFGQNIVDKNEIQLLLLADNYVGVSKHFIDLLPSILYGITDTLSIFINIPYAVNYKVEQHKSSGFEDAFVQLEYVFYSKSTLNFIDQATIVTSLTFPTGSLQKNPSTGIGSSDLFLGTTFERTYVKWLVFASPGVVLTTAKNGTKFGNSYLYQFGFGRNIADVNGWLLAWIVEFDGMYGQKNRVRGKIDSNSGGNIVYLTPSIWASTKKFIFQFGAGSPVTQNLYGNQTRSTYSLVANIGWSFY